ncbi:tRNA(Ile)-lysidine synthase [Methylocella tundrae]|uniref:tRNA(Ile)-lysidine synthase n=1 Tax=Methylocella tundrae TaxID=227605 RepID=A0A4U8Z678_METTU|nr:tRNA lysidine(34) synthetase TilS [Methylocella tundrae]VFU11061.1 tRNA(Ile)-lysidine synthase [Methylocella tundrae]
MLNVDSARPGRGGEPPPRAQRRAASIQAFSPEAIARLFQAWENAQRILLAVSGGPDSVALMLLAAEWARRRPGAPSLHVATVDHGLREDSRREAEAVAVWTARLGLTHDVLVWSGAKPRSKIQELAREARYALLFSHAARIGAEIVATAHHADDQAETILFRLLRGSGLGGLSGMAASARRQGLMLSRPLLELPKAELIAFCEAKAHPFFADPSNRNPAYARTRLRALGAMLAEEGLSRHALLRLGRRAARAEAALAARAEAAGGAFDARREPGGFSADFTALANEPEEIFMRVLAAQITVLGGQGRPLRLDRLEALTAAVQGALRKNQPFAATLAGVALKLGRDGALVLQTENPRRRGRGAPKKEPPMA